MARKPARIERSGALTPRDRVWAAIRALAGVRRAGEISEEQFSVAEIALLSGERADTVLTYVRGLAAGRFLELLEAARPEARPRREFALYRLARDVGVEAPRVTREGKPVTAGAGREAMWTAMKVLREFDCRGLAMSASTPEHRVAHDEALTYVRALCRAGYLALAREARPKACPARYRFTRARNTGPRAPLVCRDKSVMDGNTGEIFPARGGKP